MKCCKDCKYCVDTFIPTGGYQPEKGYPYMCSHKDFSNTLFNAIHGESVIIIPCELAVKRCKLEKFRSDTYDYNIAIGIILIFGLYILSFVGS